MDFGIYQDGAVLLKFVAPMSIKSNKPVFSSDSVSLKRHTVSLHAQRWEIETNLFPETGTANSLIHGVLNNTQSEFDVLMPQVRSLIDSNTRQRVTRGTGSAGSNSVILDSSAGLLPAGTFIRFANHKKVYMVVPPGVPSGSSSLTVFPALIASVTSTIMYHKATDVLLRARYDDDTASGIVFTDGIVSDPGAVRLIESFL